MNSKQKENAKLFKNFKIFLISFVKMEVEIALIIREINIEKSEFAALIEKIFIVDSWKNEKNLNFQAIIYEYHYFYKNLLESALTLYNIYLQLQKYFDNKHFFDLKDFNLEFIQLLSTNLKLIRNSLKFTDLNINEQCDTALLFTIILFKIFSTKNKTNDYETLGIGWILSSEILDNFQQYTFAWELHIYLYLRKKKYCIMLKH